MIISLSVMLLGSHISSLQWFGESYDLPPVVCVLTAPGYILTLLGAGTYRITGGQVNEIQMEMVLWPILQMRHYIQESVNKWRTDGRGQYHEIPV